MVKVSVVVPTYRSEAMLLDLFVNLDAQTMPQREIEVVLVDDGSPDDTYDLAQRLAAERGNVTAVRIEHSGWPSRPRNVGLDLATGEYVLFMDHDDRLYPDGLRACYAYGVANQADVVVGKEIRTNDHYAYGQYFSADAPGPAADRVAAYGPATTHKLFRRRFLLDSAIRFPEGRHRLWEDAKVCMEVCQHTDRISVLSSTPFYAWVHRGAENTSARYLDQMEEYAAGIEDLFDYLEGHVSDPAVARSISAYHYRIRIINYLLGPGALDLERRRGRAYYQAGITFATDFVRRRIAPSLDADLTVGRRLRVHLTRAGEADLLHRLAVHDSLIRVRATAQNASWSANGALELEVYARWELVDGTPLVFRRSGERLLRTLPEEFAEVPARLLDVTAAVRGLAPQLSLSDRKTKVAWPVPLETVPTVVPAEDDPDRLVLGFTARAEVDPCRAALGSPLENGTWDFGLRPNLLTERVVRLAFGLPDRGHLARERFEVAYATGNSLLALDLGSNVRGLVSSTRPRTDQARIERQARGHRIQIPIADLAGGAATSGAHPTLELRLGLRSGAAPSPVWFPAHLRSEGIETYLEADVRVRRGSYRVWIDDRSRQKARPTGLVLMLDRIGRASLESRTYAGERDVWDHA